MENLMKPNYLQISSIQRFFENTSSEAHITSLHYYTVFLLYISFCFKQTISLKWSINLVDQLKAIDNIWITLGKFLKSPMHFSLIHVSNNQRSMKGIVFKLSELVMIYFVVNICIKIKLSISACTRQFNVTSDENYTLFSRCLFCFYSLKK